MTERVEFGSKAAADRFREEHEQHLCSDDDRRLKTVAIASTAPDDVLEEAAIKAGASRADRDDRGGQVELTDHEREAIDFRRTSVPHARAVKGLMIDHGVDDWLSYYDHTLSVDEHREVAEDAARDERGDRLDADVDVDDHLADVEGAHSGQCDHAAGHCENGDLEACEFLQERCGYDPDQVDQIMPTPVADGGQDLEITGEAAGALKRAWQGIYGATAAIDEHVDEIREAWEHAYQAQQAINGIREAHGQQPIKIDRLKEARDQLDALAHRALDDCPVCEASDDQRDEPEEQGEPAESDQSDQQREAVVDHPLAADTRAASDEDQPVDPDEREFEHQSREFRAAQNDGYLRTGNEEKEASEREGLGRYGMATANTKRLNELDDS